MDRKRLPDNSDELWNLIEQLVAHSVLFNNWEEVVTKLKCYDNKSRRAFYARRRRQTTDWNFLANIFNALSCRIYVVIPETKEEAEKTQKVVAYKEVESQWDKLSKADKETVFALIKRLNN